MGLSFAGLSVLPLSSVMPGPLPATDTSGFEPDATASKFEVAFDPVVLGEDVDCASLALKRCLLPLDSGDGADLRLNPDGGE